MDSISYLSFVIYTSRYYYAMGRKKIIDTPQHFNGITKLMKRKSKIDYIKTFNLFNSHN